MRPTSLRSFGTIPFLLSLVLGVASCGGDSDQNAGSEMTVTTVSEAGDPVTGDWVVIHNLSDPETLNLITASDATAQELHSYIYETLTMLDPYTLETIPWIADSLPVVAPDRKSYEFTLRKEPRFSDGKPVTGEDFIFYLKTIKNPRILKAAPIRGYYERVDSAELIDGDPYRLRVVMREPYYLGNQWAGGLYAFPKHVWDPTGISDSISFAELNAGDTNRSPLVKRFAEHIEDVAKGFMPKYLVASGPYMLETYRQFDRVVLRRNPNYWNSDHRFGKAWPERLVWLTINDYNAALSALKSGEIDLMPRMDKIQYKYEKPRFAKNNLIGVEYPYPAYTYVGYNGDNAEKPFLADPLVRTAFAHSIDRKLIIDKIYFGLAEMVQSPLYRRRPEYDTTLVPVPFDLAKAASLLDQAGWKDTDGDGIRDKFVNGKKVKMEFSIMLNSGNNARKQMALIFIDALKQIGVTANAATFDWSVFLDRLDKHEFEAVIGGWVGSVVEGDLYQIWHSSSSELGASNYISYKNPRVDELIETIRGEFDYARRKEMYKEIQAILYRDQPYNFLVAETFTGAHHERFRNVSFFAPRPCYNAAWWWVPKDEQRYTTPASGNAVALK